MTARARLPKYAIINGEEAVLSRSVAHATGGGAIALFSSRMATELYVTEEEWLEGARTFESLASTQSIITSQSPPEQKIALFRDLFKGRKDVFALGYPKNNGKLGYSPACQFSNNWNVCPKKIKRDWSYPCANCPQRRLIPVSDSVIDAHLRGKSIDCRDVMALYPIDENGTCSFLAADFDGECWMAEIAAYRDAGEQLGFQVCIERSRSGNGGHAWVFFDEPVSPDLARDLGCTLITRAMASTPLISFKAYDRLFPTQTTILKNGFGNAIALPLQGRARGNGNSVFVDNHFKEHLDQWRYLSSIRKASAEDIVRAIESTGRNPLGTLAFGDAPRGGALDAPTSPAPGLFHESEATPAALLPPNLTVVKSNMLYIPKESLTPQAQNKIRRLAAFSNPNFYKAQALHQSVRGKPRVINMSEDNETSIALPRGCETALKKLAENQGARLNLIDRRNAHNPLRVTFSGTLQPRQLEAANALLAHEGGILSAPTGFGKTVIGSYVIAELKMRTLVLVPRTTLLTQWVESLAKFLIIEDRPATPLTKSGKPSKRKLPIIGQIGGGKNKLGALIDIATYQSLFEKGDMPGEPKRVKRLIQDYDLIICDECHHAAAPQLESILRTSSARCVYGLSATPKREDGMEPIAYLLIGPVRHKVSPREQALEQSFTRHIVPRFTRIRLKATDGEQRFDQVLDQICSHKARNRMICEDIMAAIDRGRRPLVATPRKNHASELVSILLEKGYNAQLLTGEGTNKEKRSAIENARKALASKKTAIVATTSYIAEGFDLPLLDTLFLTGPVSAQTLVTQLSGRLHRDYEGKRDVIVYDYIDASIPMLERMHRKRLRHYAKLGYEVMPSEELADPRLGRIVTSQDYQKLLFDDVFAAQRSIEIIAPYIHPSFLKSLKPALEAAIERGISVTVSVRKAANDGRAHDLASLGSLGCTIVEHEGHQPSIAVFDGETVWYGDLPLLAFAKTDDCSLRLKSAEVAFDLLNDERLLT